MTIKVNNVETMSPPMSANAIGIKKELLDNAIGTKPITVVVVLSIIGLNLLSTEFRQAS